MLIKQETGTSPPQSAEVTKPADAKDDKPDAKYEVRVYCNPLAIPGNESPFVKKTIGTSVHTGVAFYKDGICILALDGNAVSKTTGERQEFSIAPGSTLRVVAARNGGSDEITIASLTREEMEAAIATAAIAAALINKSQLDYKVVGILDEGQNSNSVTSTILNAMGYKYPDKQLAHLNAPGSDRILIPDLSKLSKEPMLAKLGQAIFTPNTLTFEDIEKIAPLFDKYPQLSKLLDKDNKPLTTDDLKNIRHSSITSIDPADKASFDKVGEVMQRYPQLVKAFLVKDANGDILSSDKIKATILQEKMKVEPPSPPAKDGLGNPIKMGTKDPAKPISLSEIINPEVPILVEGGGKLLAAALTEAGASKATIQTVDPENGKIGPATTPEAIIRSANNPTQDPHALAAAAQKPPSQQIPSLQMS